MQRTILVIEEEEVLRNGIAAKLRGDGYVVFDLAGGSNAVETVQLHPPSLVVLDVMLTQPDGLEVCRQLRRRPETAKVPILMLVANEIQSGQLARLQLGVNDYITKPPMWEELRACVHTLLRSRRGRPKRHMRVSRRWSKEVIDEREQVLVADDLRIDLARRKVMWHNQPIELKQVLLFDLLAYLVRHRGVVLTRDRLLQHVWGYEYGVNTRTVDVHVRWLRQILEDHPDFPQLIETVRGVGYRFKE